MRIVFCGTPEFAVPSLRRLLADPRITVEAAITQPDRPRGRGQEVSASAVKAAALEAGVHIYQPETIRSDSAFDFFQRIQPDAVVIIAYGQIVPQRLISVSRLGWINLHASLLPRYRGAAPIAWAICNGETKTGLTTMRIDSGMDTGPILLQREIEIGPDETEPELRTRLAEAGTDLVLESLVKLGHGEIAPRPQDGAKATYAPILKKEHGRIDWSRGAQEIYNRIRGLAPWPGAYTTFRGRLCHIWGRPAPNPILEPAAAGATAGWPTASEPSAGEQTTGGPREGPAIVPGTVVASNGVTLLVACGEQTCLEVQELRIEGRKRVSAAEFLNGARLRPGERFGE